MSVRKLSQAMTLAVMVLLTGFSTVSFGAAGFTSDVSATLLIDLIEPFGTDVDILGSEGVDEDFLYIEGLGIGDLFYLDPFVLASDPFDMAEGDGIGIVIGTSGDTDVPFGIAEAELAAFGDLDIYNNTSDGITIDFSFTYSITVSAIADDPINEFAGVGAGFDFLIETYDELGGFVAESGIYDLLIAESDGIAFDEVLDVDASFSLTVPAYGSAYVSLYVASLGAAVSVPEPMSLSLLGLGVMAMIRRRRTGNK